MMTQRRSWILRCRKTMHERYRPERRLAYRAAVDRPGEMFIQRHAVLCGEFAKHVVRMLLVDQWESFIGFPGLEELWRSTCRQGDRLGRQHFAELEGTGGEFALLHEHEPVHGLKAVEPARAALEVSGENEVSVCHEHPWASLLHPHR